MNCVFFPPGIQIVYVNLRGRVCGRRRSKKTHTDWQSAVDCLSAPLFLFLSGDMINHRLSFLAKEQKRVVRSLVLLLRRWWGKQSNIMKRSQEWGRRWFMISFHVKNVKIMTFLIYHQSARAELAGGRRQRVKLLPQLIHPLSFISWALFFYLSSFLTPAGGRVLLGWRALVSGGGGGYDKWRTPSNCLLSYGL